MYREHPIAPFEKIKFHHSRLDTVEIEALGTGNEKPAISMTRFEQKGNRVYTTGISFTSEEFDTLYEWMTKAKEHWQKG